MASHAPTKVEQSQAAVSEEREKIKEVIKSISDDSKSLKKLKSALEKNDGIKVREFSSSYIIEKVDMTKDDKKKGKSTLTETQLKALLEVSDRGHVKDQLKVSEILAAGKTSVRIADIDEGKRKESEGKSDNDTDKLDEELKKREQEIGDLQSRLSEAHKKISQRDDEIKNKDKELQDRGNTVEDFEGKLAKQTAEYENLLSEKKQLEKQLKDSKTELKAANEEIRASKRRHEDLQQKHDTETDILKKQLRDIAAERDVMRNRFTKLAGGKLTDQNADIANLKDPNRALKLAERFGQLYNNEWTDASAALRGRGTKLKLPRKETNCLLLEILQDCLKTCNTLKATQMDILKNVLLHPDQDVSQFASDPRKCVGGLKEKPKFSKEDETATLTLRRQIAVGESVIEEIKQVVNKEIKSPEKLGHKKKYLDVCGPYIQKCSELCWLMVLHIPPLYIKLDTKTGDKFDTNLYTIYASTGDTIDYVVWPPLFNEEGGGLLSKGVAEPNSESAK